MLLRQVAGSFSGLHGRGLPTYDRHSLGLGKYIPLGEIIHLVAEVSVSLSLDGEFHGLNNPPTLVRKFFLGCFSKKQRFYKQHKAKLVSASSLFALSVPWLNTFWLSS